MRPRPVIYIALKGNKTLEYMGFYNRPIWTMAAAAVAVTIPLPLSVTEQTEYRPPARVVQQPEVPQNLLLTTLKPAQVVQVVQKPFVQETFDNPVRRAFQDYTWFNTPKVIPQIADVPSAVFPVGQSDTDLPLKHPETNVSLLWFNSAILPKTDVTIPPEVGPQPFSQQDWPNPTLRVSWRDHTWTQSPEVIPQQFIPEVKTPFVQEILPEVSKRGFYDYGWTQNAIQTTAVTVQQQPFVQEIFPEYARRQYFNYSWTQDGIRQVAVVEFAGTVQPFNQNEWPNPTLNSDTRVSLLWFNSAILPKTDAAAPSGFASNFPPAFFQTDWPNPKLRGPWRDHTWTQTPEVITPSGTPPPETVIYTFREALVSPPVRRINPREWGFTHSQRIDTIPAVVPPPPPPPPFTQDDWQNPVNLRPNWRDYTWLQSPAVPPTIILPAGTTKPFNQSDWLNPFDLRPEWRDYGFTQSPFIIIPSAEVIVPPVVVEEGPPPGGRPQYSFLQAIKDYEHLQSIRKEAKAVIRQVAIRQALDLKSSKPQRERELIESLNARKIEYEARYSEASSLMRQYLIDQEIKELLKKKLDNDQLAYLLILIAATMA